MASSAIGASQAIQYLPAGSIVDYAGTSAPAGWLMCDGQSLPVASYPDLFSSIGYLYGGSGANFKLPDFRGRFARYNDNMGTSAGPAGRDVSPRNADKSQDDAHKTHVHGIGSHAHQWLTNAGGSNTWFTQKSLATATTTTSWGDSTPSGGANWGVGQGASGTGFVRIDDFGAGRGQHYTGAGVKADGNMADSSTQTDQSGETRPINLSCNRIIKY